MHNDPRSDCCSSAVTLPEEIMGKCAQIFCVSGVCYLQSQVLPGAGPSGIKHCCLLCLLSDLKVGPSAWAAFDSNAVIFGAMWCCQILAMKQQRPWQASCMRFDTLPRPP